MIAIRNMDKVRFPNIYILVNIHYYILPLTIIIVLAIKAVKAVVFLKARQTLSNIFAMHYGNIKDSTWIFLSGSFIFLD